MQAKEASTVLMSHGIKPTLQRIAIMRYILEHMFTQQLKMFTTD